MLNKGEPFHFEILYVNFKKKIKYEHSLDKQEWKAILYIVSGAKYHSVACMALRNVYYKL